MNTKKAIYFLEHEVKLFPHEAKSLPACLKIYKIAENIEEIIKILKRGEKFEEIIDKFNKYLKRGISLPVLSAEQSFLLEEITQKWLGINEVI